MATHQTHSLMWMEAIEDLDRGGLEEALKRFEYDEPTDDGAHRLWRAELFLYFDRLKDCRTECKLAGAVSSPLEVRRRLLLAECELWEGAHEAALAEANQIAELTEGDDPAGYARSRALVARCAIRREDYLDALPLCRQAVVICDEIGLEYSVGILLHCVAFAHLKLTNTFEVTRAFTAALAHYDRTNDLRWEGKCRSLYAASHLENGSFEEAERNYARAAEVARELGVLRDELWARNNYAHFLITLSREKEAIALLRHLADEERAEGFGIPEAYCLASLAYAFALTGQFDEVLKCANESLGLAAIHSLKHIRVLSRLLVAWASVRTGESEDSGPLRALLSELGAIGTNQEKMQATFMLADVLIESRPDEAYQLWLEGNELAEAEKLDPYTRLSKYVRQRMRAAPVRLGVGGELILDRRNGFPNLDVALETVERWLLSLAYEDAHKSKADAAEKLGVTRSRFGDRWNVCVLGEPARKSRSNSAKSQGMSSRTARKNT